MARAIDRRYLLRGTGTAVIGLGLAPAVMVGAAPSKGEEVGENYHERQLEEAFVFPAVKRTGGAAAALPDVLKAQHDRGRMITDYLLEVIRNGSIPSANAAPLAAALTDFVHMYQYHAALEDTVVFSACSAAMDSRTPWLGSLSSKGNSA